VSGGADADPNSIRFLKSIESGNVEIHAVEFATIGGEPRTSVIGITHDGGTWHVTGASGGGGSDPPRDGPWLNLGAWGWPHAFSGGGKVIGAGREAAALVRLTFANGVQLEDLIRDSYALFATESPVELPAKVDIVNSRNDVLSSHGWPANR
jgi:hypothetical protein